MTRVVRPRPGPAQICRAISVACTGVILPIRRTTEARSSHQPIHGQEESSSASPMSKNMRQTLGCETAGPCVLQAEPARAPRHPGKYREEILRPRPGRGFRSRRGRLRPFRRGPLKTRQRRVSDDWSRRKAAAAGLGSEISSGSLIAGVRSPERRRDGVLSLTGDAGATVALRGWNPHQNDSRRCPNRRFSARRAEPSVREPVRHSSSQSIGIGDSPLCAPAQCARENSRELRSTWRACHTRAIP